MEGYTKTDAKVNMYVNPEEPSTIFFISSGYEDTFIFVEETPFELNSRLMTIDEITENYGLTLGDLT